MKLHNEFKLSRYNIPELRCGVSLPPIQKVKYFSCKVKNRATMTIFIMLLLYCMKKRT